ncbi:MAG: SDR family NAD(P)-dependent oxidoreductase [Gammaproteobacteria bacterium]
MNDMNFGSKWVLVTGASSGLGMEMACQLAREHKANLILVARRMENLRLLKAEVEQREGIRCHVIAADLSVPADVDRVYEQAVSVGDVYGVILNAGVTYFGRHRDMEWSTFQNLLSTNVTSVVRLVSLFVPYLTEKRQQGGIMIVSSVASLLPVPYQAAYAGSKAFVTNFAQSLGQELRGEKVSVTVFAPGGIDTEMTRGSKLRYFENTVFLQDVKSCAHEGLQAMQLRKSLHVPGALNRTQLLLSRFIPRNLSASIARNAYRKALGL